MAESPKNPTPGIGAIPDPKALTAEWADIAQRSQHLLQDYLSRAPTAAGEMRDDMGVGDAFSELGRSLLTHPWDLVGAQVRLWEDYMRLWQSGVQRALGNEAAPVAEPARSDNRFKADAWRDGFLFDYIKQSYLIAARHIQDTVAQAQGLDPQTARKVRFFTRQFIDALSPTNFALTNPDVIKATTESGGKNLLDGLKNLLGDLERGGGKLDISMTNYDAFKLGENVATAPGKVVFQNELMQLLQYQPTTPEVLRTPLLIIPPWINKYYILDLREKNSFIRWATAQGHTVFVISWRNPDERQGGKGFEDYMLEGPVAAMQAVEQATGEPKVNVIGYCLGGTLLACLLAWLAARGEDKRVACATFFTSMIDFSEPGELGVFVDEGTVGRLEQRMAERGYLEGSEMATTFNLLRANDLIWSFVVNNYLLGKEPFPFDLLYWNSDSTRMPAKMQTFYLRNMYIGNKLIQPDALEIAGQRIDLGRIKTPAYFLSTLEDHIAPWKSTYSGARRLPGPVTFTLAGSGHIAGVVNPPSANKYCHWVSGTDLPDSADQWLERAQRHEGSWWNHWHQWVESFDARRVPARTPGDGKLPVLEDAPGSYVKVRLSSGAAVEGAAKPVPPAVKVAAPPPGPTAPVVPQAVVAAPPPKPAAPVVPEGVVAAAPPKLATPVAPAPIAPAAQRLVEPPQPPVVTPAPTPAPAPSARPAEAAPSRRPAPAVAPAPAAPKVAVPPAPEAQAPSQPVESKPATSKPVEVKPAELKAAASRAAAPQDKPSKTAKPTGTGSPLGGEASPAAKAVDKKGPAAPTKGASKPAATPAAFALDKLTALPQPGGKKR